MQQNRDKSLAKAPALLYAKFTLEKSLMTTVNVENPLAKSPALLNNRELTLDKDLECSECGKAFSLRSRFIRHQEVSQWSKTTDVQGMCCILVQYDAGGQPLGETSL